MVDKKTKVATIILSLLLANNNVLAATDDKTAPFYTLDKLTAANISKTQKEKSSSLTENSLRLEALREVALSVGASAGLSYEYDKIYSELVKSKEKELDKAYNFEDLKLSAGIMPPVISQSHSPYELQDNNTVWIGTNNFKIEKPARMVSAYPTWRDYLTPRLPEFDLPTSALLPRNKKESELWNAAVQEGWLAGQKQARDAWQHSLGELQRDYNGMILYRSLLYQGKITPTVVANSNLGTVVNEDGTEMSLNVNQIGITSHSRFDKQMVDTHGAPNPSVYKGIGGQNY